MLAMSCAMNPVAPPGSTGQVLAAVERSDVLAVTDIVPTGVRL